MNKKKFMIAVMNIMEMSDKGMISTITEIQMINNLRAEMGAPPLDEWIIETKKILNDLNS